MMKKKILSLFSILLVAFFITSNVSALSIAEAGENIEQTGSYDSLRFGE